MLEELAINLLKEEIDYLEEEGMPEYKHSNMEEWDEWSNSKHVYTEILQQIQDGGQAYDVIERYASKMVEFAYVSKNHGSMYMDAYYICENLIEMLCEEEDFYWNQHYLN